MNKKKIMRKTALVLVLALMLSVALMGCGSKDSGTAAGEKGRFVETIIEENLEHVNQVFGAEITKEGDLQFFAAQYKEDGSCTLTENILSASGAGLQVTEIDWANELLIGRATPMAYDAAGEAALLLYQNGEGEYALARHENGETQPIEMEEWNQPMDYNDLFVGGLPTEGAAGEGSLPNPVTMEGANVIQTTGEEGAEMPDGGHAIQGFQINEEAGGNISIGGFFEEGIAFSPLSKYPLGIACLENGEFLVSYSEEGVSHYTGDAQLLREYPGMMFTSGIAVDNGQVAVTNAETSDIVLYNLESGEETGSLAAGEISFDLCVDFGENALFTADKGGIHCLGDSERETIVDSGLTSLMLPTYSKDSLVAASETEFYMFLSNEMGEMQLMHYTFDENLSAKPETQLRIFSLYDNNTIRQAIGEFQRANRDVQITLEVGIETPEMIGMHFTIEEGAVETDNSATVEDVIRSLNTELLNGTGPDLIVLNGLPLQSYVEKGVLTDITDLTKEVISSENLMENLMGTYEIDGKVYAVPSRFSVPVMIGEEELLNELHSLNDLAQLVEDQQGETPAVLSVPMELWDTGIMMKYYDSCCESFTNADGSLDEAALTAYFEDMLRLDAALKAHSPQLGEESMIFAVAISGGSAGFENIDTGSWELRDGKARLHLQELAGFMNLRSLSGDLEEKDTMQLHSVFQQGLYHPLGSIGITSQSKNQEVAEEFLRVLLSDGVQSQYLYDGFPVNETAMKNLLDSQLTDADITVSDMGFADLCKTLTTPVFTDEIIKAAVKEQTKALQDGSKTPQQAAAAVVENTRLYLAE